MLEFDGSTAQVRKHLGITQEELQRFESDSSSYYVKLRKFYQAINSKDPKQLSLPQLKEHSSTISKLKDEAWSEATRLNAQMKAVSKQNKLYRETYQNAFKALTIQLQKSFETFNALCEAAVRERAG